MRHATYLCCSRHGIYYFRWPLPPQIHPKGKRSDVKVSTGMRCPRAALELSRLLYLAGQSLLRKAALLGMRYDEIRMHVQEHFRGLLQRFKTRRAETGPLDGLDLDALLTSQMFANEGLKDWAAVHEIAQLHLIDIKREENVWYFDVSEADGENKSLKNTSSRRRVPMHTRLIELGLLEFIESRKGTAERLFPDLPYSSKNGYGRNLGRWFNESFLNKIGLSGRGLSFHCLRHTFVTRLSQCDVQVKALVGHSQDGVTLTTYFKEGYRVAQLKAAIDRMVLN